MRLLAKFLKRVQSSKIMKNVFNFLNVSSIANRTFDTLHNPVFRRVWSIGAFYYTYRATELAVLSWFVLELTDSELQVALIGVSRIAPMFLFGLVSGGLADRFTRHWLMRGVQSINFLAGVLMVIALYSGIATAIHAYAMIFITGTTWSIDYAARRALLGALFEGKELTSATALDSGLVTGSNLIGPLLGTILIRFVDFGGAYVGISFMMASALLLVLSMRVNTPQAYSSKAQSVLSQLSSSIELMRTNRAVLGTVLLTASFNFFGWPYVQMVPVIARDILNTGEIQYGLLLSSLGFGAMIGALLIASIKPIHKGNVYSLGAALLMAAAIAYAWAPWYWLAIFWMFIAGIGLGGFAGMQPVLALEAVGSELRGRAMGAIVLGIGFQAPGMFVMGAIGEIIGPRESVTYVGGVGLVSIVILRQIFPALADKTKRLTDGTETSTHFKK